MSRSTHECATSAILNAQTAHHYYQELGVFQRMLLRMVGGRFVRFAVLAGEDAAEASALQMRPRREGYSFKRQFLGHQ